MTNAIDKFIDYLTIEKDKIENDIISYYGEILSKEKINHSEIEASIIAREKTNKFFITHQIMARYNNLDYNLKFLNNSIEYNQSRGLIIHDYKDVSSLLLESPLNFQEKIKSLFFILKKSYLSMTDNAVLLDYDVIKKLRPDNISEIEYKKFFFSGDIVSFINTADDNLSDNERSFKKTLLQNIQETEHSKSFKIAMRNINKHFFIKMDDLTEKDIMITAKALAFLHVDDKLCTMFTLIYNKKMQKQNESSKIITIPKNVGLNDSRENKMNNREVKKIWHEIMEYYDIQNQEAKRFLSLEEIIYLKVLLKKANFSAEEINTCLSKIRKFNNKFDNVITKYNFYYAKLLSLKENEEINCALEYINECLEQMFIPESKQAYLEWKKEINTIFEEIKYLLEKSDYELELERKYNKI